MGARSSARGGCCADGSRYDRIVPRTRKDAGKIEACTKEQGFVERVQGQGERVHIPLGARCNNHCLFCMEDNRVARAQVNGAMTAERVRRILDRHPGAEEVCFTSGEPTLHPRLPEFIRWARLAGCRRVSLMTNGRRLGYVPYAQTLARAGLGRVYVSIHGPGAVLHDGLTRSPGSFDQTLAGLRVAACLEGVDLHTSTVVTKRNVAALLETYEMLVDIGVGQVVFNALQVHGGAATHFDRMVPRYAEVRRQFEGVLKLARDGGRRAFLVDVPPCFTHGLPDRNRGYFEKHLHYEADVPGIEPTGAKPCDGFDGVRSVATESLDAAFRTFGPNCPTCRYRPVCPGVYERYVRVFGWEEFEAVQDSDQA
jgi:cyclic pyranopterin phosphate synthase